MGKKKKEKKTGTSWVTENRSLLPFHLSLSSKRSESRVNKSIDLEKNNKFQTLIEKNYPNDLPIFDHDDDDCDLDYIALAGIYTMSAWAWLPGTTQ